MTLDWERAANQDKLEQSRKEVEILRTSNRALSREVNARRQVSANVQAAFKVLKHLLDVFLPRSKKHSPEDG